MKIEMLFDLADLVISYRHFQVINVLIIVLFTDSGALLAVICADELQP